ncbi:exosortase A [Zoogloea sp.]|uniref:exosortase A n=1 Tax=Zoogloea sp. TaxID=49181 RepID=UPI002605065E|nr:exosortase A [Zoogloea sp.]MDD3352546.1 EpsI family protein [Zoogloea sp.]
MSFFKNKLPSALISPSGAVALAVLLAWVAILLSFARHVALVLEAWETLPSHSHGYVVLLVVAYFLWMKRPLLAELNFAPSWKGFVFLNIMGLAALLGSMISVAAVVQFATVFMMFGAVWAIAGDRAARVTFGPLSFLLFAVPFGHEVLPVLMNWTADATVAALRGSGIPVYQEGRNFIIPSGSWSVVEACGGIRYLLTSIFIGAVFAYMTYTRPLKRMVFMLWAVVMPLVANWIRAYVIVVVAHLSGNEWGLGMSHLALGWVIFGLAILASFAVGARWADPQPVLPTSIPAVPAIPLRKVFLAAFFAAVVPVVWYGAALGVEAAGKADTPILAMESLSRLERSTSAVPGIQPSFPGAKVVHQGTYVFEGEPVEVFIAFFRDQTQGAEMVNVSNKLEPSGDWSWGYSGKAGRASAELPEMQLEGYVRGPRYAALHRLYWVGGMTTTGEITSKVLQVLSRLRGRGDDSAFVAFTAYSGESVADASRKLQAFEAALLAGVLKDLDRTALEGQAH